MKLNEPTAILFLIACESRTLMDVLGVAANDAHGKKTLRWNGRTQQFLIERNGELAFDPDIFEACIGARSTGTQHMMLWLLHVWNPHGAKVKGWKFDLFEAMNSLDHANRACVGNWIKNPIWP